MNNYKFLNKRAFDSKPIMYSPKSSKKQKQGWLNKKPKNPNNNPKKKVKKNMFEIYEKQFKFK